MKKILSFITFAVILTTINVKANNIQLDNVSVGGQNTAGKFTLISFDVSWENSWRTIRNEANYDGAWIFVKFRRGSSSVWQHATINNLGGIVPAGSLMKTSLDGKGVWIYRAPPSVSFFGNVNYAGAKLRWNYGVDGVLDTDDVEVRVFAIEMVYIPQGAFKLGSGGSESQHFYSAGSNNPYTVTAETTPITVSLTSGLYYASTTGYGGDQAGPIPAAFPKGYGAFWIMKYECSQKQYAAFLNNLDAGKAGGRNPSVLVGFSGLFPSINAPYPERAMNFISINDYLAFADWAGLRPPTELEFEKACRGVNQEAVPNEYPWGNTTVSQTVYVTNAGLNNEVPTWGNVNVETYHNEDPEHPWETGLLRPSRVGMYATATSTRESSASTYYGVLDMAGNVSEICICVGNANGRSFTGVNGDGKLTNAGEANVTAWPSVAEAFIPRGGSCRDNGPTLLRTSLRIINKYPLTTRYEHMGIRLGRTAE